MVILIFLILACDSGLEPLNESCPGGLNCWCPWDTGHDYHPELDKNGHIICDTGKK